MNILTLARKTCQHSKVHPRCRRVILENRLVPLFLTHMQVLCATNGDRKFIVLSRAMREEMFRLIAEQKVTPLVYRLISDFRTDYPALPRESNE